jgi:hypothetical protein
VARNAVSWVRVIARAQSVPGISLIFVVRRFITSAFDKENVRTLAAAKQYAEAQSLT